MHNQAIFKNPEEWFLVVYYKETYHCGDYDTVEQTASPEQAQHMLGGIDGIELRPRILTEKLITIKIDPEFSEEVTVRYVTDKDGEYTFVIEGVEYKANKVQHAEYSWVPPKETEAYKKAVLGGEVVEESYSENDGLDRYFSTTALNGLRGKKQPMSLTIKKRVKEECVFVRIANADTLNKIVDWLDEVTFENWYNSMYHIGYGPDTENPVKVKAIIER